MTEKDLIKAILDWCVSRNPAESRDAQYPGMKNVRDFIDPVDWYLSVDPDSPSHELARKVGTHIAESIAPFIN